MDIIMLRKQNDVWKVEHIGYINLFLLQHDAYTLYRN